MSDPIRINYVIATFSGISPRRERVDKGITPSTLQLHLQHLIPLLPSCTMVKQITIVRPHVDTHQKYQDYYDISTYVDHIENTIGIPVKIIDINNYTTGVSYSQYRHTYSAYPDFDFYMLLEDDWVPVQHMFDKILLDAWSAKYKTTSDNGYLCMWYPTNTNYPHAAISVGIISKVALETLHAHLPLSHELPQYEFSVTLVKLGTTITDYSENGDKWRILFWDTNFGSIFDYSYGAPAKECLIAPLQVILKDEKNYDIVERHWHD